MKFTVTEPKSWKRVLEIEVPSAQMQDEIDSEYKRFREQMKLPGFRKGKVPRDVLKARFGDNIRAEVLQRLIPDSYEQVCKEADLVPLNQPVIDEIEYEEGQDLRFKATVEVKPSIDLKEYKGIRVLKRPVNITDDDINESLEGLRDRHADIVRVEEAAAENHYLLADIQTMDSTGIPIIGRKQENQFFQIGGGRLGEPFDEQLVGVKAGEDRRVTTVYPDDYEEEALAGQDANFLVTVRDVLEKRLPDLDDEFAMDVGAENLDALKVSIQHNLEQEPEREVRAQLVNHLVENNTFDVPESMLDNYLDRIVADIKRRSQEPVSDDDLRQQYRPIATDQIKRYLILEEIAEREHFDITQNEVDEHMERIAEQRNIQVAQVKRMLHGEEQRKGIESDIREEKVIEFLVQHADIKVE